VVWECWDAGERCDGLSLSFGLETGGTSGRESMRRGRILGSLFTSFLPPKVGKRRPPAGQPLQCRRQVMERSSWGFPAQEQPLSVPAVPRTSPSARCRPARRGRQGHVAPLQPWDQAGAPGTGEKQWEKRLQLGSSRADRGKEKRARLENQPVMSPTYPTNTRPWRRTHQ